MPYHGPYAEGPFQAIREVHFPRTAGWRLRLIARHTKNTGGLFGYNYDGAVMVQGLVGDRFVNEYFAGDPLQGGVVYFLPASDMQFDEQGRCQTLFIMDALVPDSSSMFSIYIGLEQITPFAILDSRQLDKFGTGGASAIAGGYILKSGTFSQFTIS